MVSAKFCKKFAKSGKDREVGGSECRRRVGGRIGVCEFLGQFAKRGKVMREYMGVNVGRWSVLPHVCATSHSCRN